jgi:hypothetical protein
MAYTPDLAAVSADLSAALSQFLPVDPNATLDEMINAVRAERAADTDIQLDPDTAMLLNGALEQAVNFLTSQPGFHEATLTSHGLSANQGAADLHRLIADLASEESPEADCN